MSSAVAEAPASTTTTTTATVTPSAPAAAPSAPKVETPSNPLADAIGSKFNDKATADAVAQVEKSAEPTVSADPEASIVDGEGDADPSSAVEADSDAVIDAVRKLIARGVTREEIAGVKDRSALLLMSRLMGDERAAPDEKTQPKEGADAVPASVPDFGDVSAKFAAALGLDEAQTPLVNDFARAIAAPFAAKFDAAVEGIKRLAKFVEDREITRAATPLGEKYPRIKTPEGLKALRDMLGKMNGARFADYDAFVSAAADAAFANEWLTQKAAERAKVNAAKARSRAVVTESAPRVYSEDELASIRADMVIAGKSPDEIRQHISRLTGKR